MKCHDESISAIAINCLTIYVYSLTSTAHASLANKKYEEVKVKAPKGKSLKKLLGKAANAILTAAALGKRRRAEYDCATSLPSTTDTSKTNATKNLKRVNNQQSARCHANDSTTKAPSGYSLNDSTRDVGTIEKRTQYYANKMTSPEAMRMVVRNHSPGAIALPTRIFIEGSELGCYDHDGYDAEGENSSVVKKMRVEIDRLQEENVELLNEQFTRETEIRVEVIKIVEVLLQSLPVTCN